MKKREETNEKQNGQINRFILIITVISISFINLLEIKQRVIDASSNYSINSYYSL